MLRKFGKQDEIYRLQITHPIDDRVEEFEKVSNRIDLYKSQLHKW